MSKDLDKKELEKLSGIMRQEWDRRIDHDYRYWMSDGVGSDQEMWQVGERDLEIILKGLDLESLKSQTALEIGCGVGRILRATAKTFNKAVGLDVSESAVREARRLLADLSNVEIVHGNGCDMSQVESASIDFVYTFAALSSMPIRVIASYILESSRVMKTKGVARLQVYLGTPTETVEQDSIAIRTIEQDCFIAAANAAGFRVEAIDELVLPFKISDHATGQVAYIASLRKERDATIDVDSLCNILLPDGERVAGDNWEGSITEYYMAIHRATQHMDAGNIDEAKRAIIFALNYYKNPEPGVVALLDEIEKLEAQINPSVKNQPQQTDEITVREPEVIEQLQVLSGGGDSLFELNIAALGARWPDLASSVASASHEKVLSKTVNEHPVVFFGQMSLDQVQKPIRAAEVWAERTLNSQSVKSADEIIVYGFASSYHLKALLKLSAKPVHVFEPGKAIIKEALSISDCRELITSVASISTSLGEFSTNVGNSNSVKRALVEHTQSKIAYPEEFRALKSYLWKGTKSKSLRPSIAVVGPLYGGSLPIAGYVHSALQKLGHRSHYYDLSPYCDSYMQIAKTLRDKGRADTIESSYVEMLSDLVLEATAERPIDILICLAQAPLSGRALNELRNRGVITAMWFVEDCRRFLTWQSISKYYDFMFLIQKEPFITIVETAGAGRASYLPLACDPDIHAPKTVDASERERWGSPISFVGAGYNNRRNLFASLANYPFKIWGTEWPGCIPFNSLVQEGGRRVSPEEYVKVFNSSDINLNLHSSTERDGVDPNGDFVNPRTFELASAGAFQLADNRTLLPELFEVGKEIVTFADKHEMIEKINYYMENPHERKAVVDAARARVLKEHTYEKRVEAMLDSIFAEKGDYLEQRMNEGPWPRTLKSSQKFPDLKQTFEQVFERGADPTLEELVCEIKSKNQPLDDTGQKLMFLHNLKSTISYVNNLRAGKPE